MRKGSKACRAVRVPLSCLSRRGLSLRLLAANLTNIVNAYKGFDHELE